MKRTLAAVTMLGAILLPAGSSAAVAGIGITDAWIRHIPGGASAGYFTLRNGTDRPVRLVGAKSPTFGKVMLHRTRDREGAARMEHVQGVKVAPDKVFRFAPGDHHLMLMKPREGLETGQTVPITLRFADGTVKTAEFPLRPPYAQGPE